MTRPNGVTTNYTYDTCTNLQLCSILHQVSGSTIDGTSYTYDNAGNRLTKSNQRTGLVSNYTYDSLYEVTQAVEGGTTTGYTYDAVGNRATMNGASYTTTTSNNELTGIPQTYLSPAATQTFDSNGNTLTRASSSGTTTYNWDFENRLTSVVLPGSGGTVSFKYDPFGRRIQKVAPSGTTNFVYDGANVLEDVDSSGSVLARYVQSTGIDEPLAETRSSVTSYYEADGLGSVTSLTNSSHALANTYTYDTYGSISASTGSVVNRFNFTGREYDSETGMYYYRARYYDPIGGRFVSEDPAKYAAGINFYAYVENAPVDLTDPSGLCPWEVQYRDLNHSRALGKLGFYHFFFYNTQTGQALGLGPAPVSVVAPTSGPLGDLVAAVISQALPIATTVPGRWETQESAETKLLPVPDWLCNCVGKKMENPGNPPDYNTWAGQINLSKQKKRNCLGWAGNVLQECYNEEYPNR